jgi:hypothetical protein
MALRHRTYFISGRARFDLVRAEDLARRLHKEDGDGRWLCWALKRSAARHAALGEMDAAQAELTASLEFEDRSWTPQLRATAGLATEQALALHRGDAKEMLRLAHQHVRLVRAAGDRVDAATSNLIDSLVVAGDLSGAIREGLALVSQLEGTRYESDLAVARLNLLSAYLATDNGPAARALVEVGWPSAIRFEMQAWWADYLALLAALEGRFEGAARLAGYSDAMYERTEDKRQHNETTALERARELVRGAIGEAAMQRLQADGAHLRDDEIAGIALASD